ncbi:MAG: hypothetical protein PHW02_03850 [bacterium]|nr:hypothetical protein [bacterium]
MLFKKKFKKDEKYVKVELSPAQMFYTNALSIEALVNVLERKSILNKEEVLDEIKKLGAERKNKMEELNENIKKS